MRVLMNEKCDFPHIALLGIVLSTPLWKCFTIKWANFNGLRPYCGQKWYAYDKISEIAHLNWFPKFKKIFCLAHLPHTIFLIRIDPQNNVQLVNTQKKNSYFCKTQFFIFCSFFPLFLTRRSLNLGATRGSLSIAHLP